MPTSTAKFLDGDQDTALPGMVRLNLPAYPPEARTRSTTPPRTMPPRTIKIIDEMESLVADPRAGDPLPPSYAVMVVRKSILSNLSRLNIADGLIEQRGAEVLLHRPTPRQVKAALAIDGVTGGEYIDAEGTSHPLPRVAATGRHR